ncbi:MAG: bacterioferritin, partial [Acidobacteriota bacterium]
MKGNKEIISKLNELLTDELTAVNQYIVHSEMCSNWGYGRLHDAIEKRAIQEMKHAEKLIERILFLSGKPVVSNLNKISIGEKVETQIRNDLAAEEGALKSYNESVDLAARELDNGNRDLLESILHYEEEHYDWLEA